MSARRFTCGLIGLATVASGCGHSRTATRSPTTTTAAAKPATVQQVGHTSAEKQSSNAVRNADFTQSPNAPSAVVPANGTGQVPRR